MKNPIDILFAHWKAWADATHSVNATRRDLEETGLAEVVIPAMEEYARQEVSTALRLLRSLADIQNGPPLIQHAEEWKKTITEIYEFLNQHETDKP